MNHDDVLAVLPDRRVDTKSIKVIAQAMGLENLKLCRLGEGRAATGQGLGRSDQKGLGCL